MTGRAVRRVTPLAAQRAVLLTGIALTTAAAWTYSARTGAHLMHRSPPGLPVVIAMWTAMTAGMMLPAATPMFAAYMRVHARQSRPHPAPVVAFVLAYLLLWIGVSIAGAWTQQHLAAAGLVSHLGASTRPALSAALLGLAGAYQFSPLKHACLRRCRTPLGFLLTEWRPGTIGALKLGLLHGRDCIACCWALMALAFVLGTMNVVWMAALTVLMLAEKTAPGGHILSRASGIAFVGWGMLLLAHA